MTIAYMTKLFTAVFLEKHPDVVETFLQEHIAATDAVNNDSDASVDAIIKEIENVTGISYDRGTVLSAFFCIVNRDYFDGASF